MPSEITIDVEIPEGAKMTQLERRALACKPMEKTLVAEYDRRASITFGLEAHLIQNLCASHERLRMEVEGVGQLIKDHDEWRMELKSVLSIMDDHAGVWGDEGVFRRCRDRLRALVQHTPQQGE